MRRQTTVMIKAMHTEKKYSSFMSEIFRYSFNTRIFKKRHIYINSVYQIHLFVLRLLAY